jgi:hypothetical protein
VLVDIAAGAEASPVARHVVRNAWHGEWPGGALSDLRPMRIPDGADVERLGCWAQDAAGRTVAAAQALCAGQPVPCRAPNRPRDLLHILRTRRINHRAQVS